jgi:hypothetical protein
LRALHIYARNLPKAKRGETARSGHGLFNEARRALCRWQEGSGTLAKKMYKKKKAIYKFLCF